MANGVVREATYGRSLSDSNANRASVLTAISAFAAYFWFLQRRWPIQSDAEAARIGGLWLLLTISFEFGFGRLVAKRSWGELGGEYDLSRSRLWPLVLAWLAAGPALTRHLQAESMRACR